MDGCAEILEWLLLMLETQLLFEIRHMPNIEKVMLLSGSHRAVCGQDEGLTQAQLEVCSRLHTRCHMP